MAVKFISNANPSKIALHRRECLTGVGNHHPNDTSMRRAKWVIPIWHFKWHSDCRANQIDKIESDKDEFWAEKMVESVGRMQKKAKRTIVDWDSLPPEAYPKLAAWKKRGAYPLA
jgi:hypothetical protein